MKNAIPNPDLWRSWPLSRLEREYSPSSCVPSSRSFTDAYAERSREAARRLSFRPNLRWGDGDDETFDFFPAADANAPLLIFIHGGYWQELSKSDSLFIAPNCIANGIAYAAIEYTLAPHASVIAIVEQCRRAALSLSRQASALGCDARRIFVAGSSAGAHLAAMLLVDVWQKTSAPRNDLIAGTILLSGIYDLEPLVGTYINKPLDLTNEEARILSPQRLELGRPMPVIVAWGENETSEFKRQSQTFASKLKAADFSLTSLEIAGANHFDIVFGIADPAGALGRAALDMILDGTTLVANGR